MQIFHNNWCVKTSGASHPSLDNGKLLDTPVVRHARIIEPTTLLLLYWEMLMICSRLRFMFAVVFALVSFSSGSVRAEVLIGNLPTANDAGSNSIGKNLFGNTFERAVKFTMPSTAYTVDNVVLRLSEALSDGPPLITIRAGDNGDDPGSLLATLNNPLLSDSMDDYTFTPIGTITLAADSSYWVQVSHATNVADFQWWTSSGNNEPTGAATWEVYRQRANGGVWGNNNTPSTFEINATPIPEPTSLMLLNLCGWMLLLPRVRQ